MKVERPNQLGLMLFLGLLICLFVLVSMECLMCVLNDTISIIVIRDVVLVGILSVWLLSGSHAARILTLCWLTYLVISLTIAIASGEPDSIGYAIAFYCSGVCLFAYYVLVVSNDSKEYLNSRLTVNQSASSTYEERHAKPQLRYGYCNYCKQKVEVIDVDRCPRCNWPVDELTAE